jgi:DhnA family fructose-bisphosphate aldolase class Ia
MRDKEIVGLYQAYLDVYSNSNEEVEQLDEDVQGAVKGALEKGANIMKTNPVLKAVGSIIANPGRKTPTATSGGYRKEEVEELDEVSDELVEMLVTGAANKREMEEQKI